VTYALVHRSLHYNKLFEVRGHAIAEVVSSGLSLFSSKLNPRPIHVGFMVAKVVLRFSSEYFVSLHQYHSTNVPRSFSDVSLMLYSETWILHPLKLCFPWLHAHFDWSCQNFHKRSVKSSFNIRLCHLPSFLIIR